MLRDLDLTWYVRDGIIVVTNIEVESNLRFATSYNVEPLLRSGMTTESLTNLLMTHTRSNWQDIDGEGGRVSLVGNVLTVWQSYQAQREVRQVLLKLAVPGELPWVDFAAERESFAEFIHQPTAANFVEDYALSDFVNTVARESGVPIVIDAVAMSDAGHTVDLPLSVPPVASVPRSAVFRLALDEHDLTVVLKHGVPTVTTSAVAGDSSSFGTAVYQVASLLKSAAERRALIDAIQASAGGYWEDIDGEGGVLTLTENGLLVVSHTAETHRSVQRLLAVWRASSSTSKAAVSVDTEPVTKFYHMPIETAESLKTVIPEMVAPESWKSDANPNGGTIHAIALAQNPPQASAPEKKNVEPSNKEKEKPSDGSKAAWIGEQATAVLAQFGGGGGFGADHHSGFLHICSPSTGVLVVTQTPAVHSEIDRFFASLRVTTRGRNEATANDVGKSQFGGMGGGGGFF